jgi:DNA repair exonuclease SbcCD nuclease subunit
MIKFIHTADWHLGMQAHFLPDEPRARFAEDRFASVRAIGDLAQDENCSFVVVAGDVFDSNHADRGVIARAIEALASFTVPVFLLPGNHDPLDASSIYQSPEWLERCPDGVVVLREPVAIPVGSDGTVEIVGVPWIAKQQLGDPVSAGYKAEASSEGAIRVVVGHGIVDEISPDRDDPSLIKAAEIRTVIGAGVISYLALGDRHSVTEVANSDGRAWYAGTPVSTDYDQIKPNEVLLVQLDGADCRVECREIGSWAFLKKDFDLLGAGDVDKLESWLQSVPEKQSTAVKLVLRGTLNLVENARLEEILEHNGFTFASLNMWERHTDLVVAPSDEDLSALDVSGYVREALDELAAKAGGTDEDAAISSDALNLLYRLVQ